MKKGSCVYFVVIATRRNVKLNSVVRKLILNLKVAKEDKVLKRERKERKTDHCLKLIKRNVNINLLKND